MNDKPRPSITIWILATIGLIGLLAQFLAAEGAFAMIGRGPAYSVSAALLIESAVVIEALIIAATGNWLALIGLGVSLAVSGTYNYTIAEAAGTNLGVWQLGTLAVGPLVALATIGLALGLEVRAYLEKLYRWEDAQAQARKAEVDRERQQEQIQERLDRERQAAMLRIDLEAEEARRMAEIKQMELDARNRRRIERETAKAKAQAENDRKVTGKANSAPEDAGSQAEDGSNRPEWLPVIPADKSEFSDLVRKGKIRLPEDLTGADLAKLVPAIGSERTGRNWLADARELSVSPNGR